MCARCRLEGGCPPSIATAEALLRAERAVGQAALGLVYEGAGGARVVLKQAPVTKSQDVRIDRNAVEADRGLDAGSGNRK